MNLMMIYYEIFEGDFMGPAQWICVRPGIMPASCDAFASSSSLMKTWERWQQMNCCQV